MKVKHAYANSYRVLHDEVEHILTFYKWDGGEHSLKEYINEYHGNVMTWMVPLFKRNGFYQNRRTGFTWMEINDLAFTNRHMKAQFDYDLSVLNQKVHSTREINAMNELFKLNSLSPKCMQEIRQALYNNKNRTELRLIGLSGLRTRKRVIAFKEKHNIAKE
jgi:hypothetical protein